MPLQIERHFMPSSSHQTEAITTLLALPKPTGMAAAEQLFGAQLNPSCGSGKFLLPFSHLMFQFETIASIEGKKPFILRSSRTSIWHDEDEQS